MIGYYKGRRRGTTRVVLMYGVLKETTIFDPHFGLIAIGQVC